MNRVISEIRTLSDVTDVVRKRLPFDQRVGIIEDNGSVFLVHCPGEEFQLLPLHLLFKRKKFRVRIHIADARETPALKELDNLVNLIGIKNSKFWRRNEAIAINLIDVTFP